MRRSARWLWWCSYGTGCIAVVLGLAWISMQVLRLERNESVARAEVAQQETIHLALWRMDSWLAPLLARESARTWFEYQAYYPQVMAFNRVLEPIDPGEVVVPSTLLTFHSDLLPLHVQYREHGGFTSPQVPSTRMLEDGIVGCVPVLPDPTKAERLHAFATSVDGDDLLTQVALSELRYTVPGGEAPIVPAPFQTDTWVDNRAKMARDAEVDYKARLSAASQAQTAYVDGNTMPRKQSGGVLRPQQVEESPVATAPPTANPTGEVGPLVPIWLGTPPDRLLLARRVQVAGERLLQGVVVDWPGLRRELLARIVDLFPPPGGALEPVLDPADTGSGSSLASLPVRFVPPAHAPIPAVVGTGVAMGLAIVWFVAVGALGTTGLALHRSIRSAVQTSRFASSVTHELRTPLTTFRLYAEMLADGMVPDEAQRRAYLETLRDESTRLGLLVENVLAWSRVEEGRSAGELRPVRTHDLIAAAEPLLRRRCEEAGAVFDIRMNGAELTASADPARVRQVLFNLVDNACKYAGSGASVRLTCEARDGHAILAIDDDGPGIPAPMRQRIFRAFDRGSLGAGDAVRGLGLGLAISSELARSQSGTLRCTDGVLGGARFELELPRVQGGAADA